MSIQINYLLIFTDADNITKIQVFTEPGEAYKTMEIEYETTILQLKQDETEFKNSIEQDYALIDFLDCDKFEWKIEKHFVQTPEIAAIMRQYGKIIEETEKFYRYREAYRSSEFYVREIKVRINAHYVNDNKILYFTVSHSPYQDGDFIPFEAYKWCVDRGFKKVSDIAEAKRILACLDINSKFREKEFIG